MKGGKSSGSVTSELNERSAATKVKHPIMKKGKSSGSELISKSAATKGKQKKGKSSVSELNTKSFRLAGTSTDGKHRIRHKHAKDQTATKGKAAMNPNKPPKAKLVATSSDPKIRISLYTGGQWLSKSIGTLNLKYVGDNIKEHDLELPYYLSSFLELEAVVGRAAGVSNMNKFNMSFRIRTCLAVPLNPGDKPKEGDVNSRVHNDNSTNVFVRYARNEAIGAPTTKHHPIALYLEGKEVHHFIRIR